MRFGLGEDRRSKYRNPRFASFLAQADPRSRNSDAYDARLRARRVVQRGLVALAVLAGAWVVVESAKALTMF
ncbi:hypothetical protein K0B96_01370 [Horticoccus luteus]|uniref:Uncharacterized protein n=1 Tax=Horticoccus luteus TaxID=2862869 RepID=A0A8F9U067_9BACT|nr:hypothetical protein K0B96_01370 [Horticoccus luteus]